ncbi:pilus assembly protein TadG-related protein [Streptomyces sp. RB6PN25]|uniref:Pilus assembly protein TadG-related protein n=1 Tax=Streptomyces humicola TaxID=2953240 RepID=A0ABT1PX51_9ACTN|nr:pilus assembly protein TadG-related protein [Streptomyces humicola]
MAVAALLLLAVAFFAVGQASAVRGDAQTAADAAALAAARSERDGVQDALLKALTSGNLAQLGTLLQPGANDCAAAGQYAADNRASVTRCDPANGEPGYTVKVISLDTVGGSPVQGTQSMHATATATAVIEPRCTVQGKNGNSIRLTCDGNDISIDPTAAGFHLDLADFFTVHLST